MSVVRVARESDKIAWNDFVRTHPWATFFHLWEWGEVIKRVFQHRNVYLIAEEQGNLAGVFPLTLLRSVLFKRRLISMPFCEYGGPLVVRPTCISSFLNKILSLASVNKLDYVEIRTLCSPRPIELIKSKGFKELHRYVTFRLSLSPSKDLWRRLNKKTRNAIRKAIKNEIVAREIENIDGLEAFYYLYGRVMKRHGSPPYPYKFFTEVWRSFRSNDVPARIKFFVAEYNSQPIAGICASLFRKDVEWWMSVSDPKYKHLNPTYLLLWSLLDWAATNGYEIFDFGRTRLNTGVYRFKKRWNGIPFELPTYVYFPRGIRELPDPTTGMYVYLSKLWSFVPICLATKIGPKIIGGIGL